MFIAATVAMADGAIHITEAGMIHGGVMAADGTDPDGALAGTHGQAGMSALAGAGAGDGVILTTGAGMARAGTTGTITHTDMLTIIIMTAIMQAHDQEGLTITDREEVT